MKKIGFTLVMLGVAGAAYAQASVTVFGTVDASLSQGSGSVANRTRLANSGNKSSEIGFRGSEDLGGGLYASFFLAAGLNNDDGTGAGSNTNNQLSGATPGNQGLAFNRQSTVSIGGGFGEVRLGRDYTPQFWNVTKFDPFGNVGVGSNLVFTPFVPPFPTQFPGLPTPGRASNAVGYFLPSNLGGFHGQVQYYLGENTSNAAGNTAKDGNGGGLRVGYTGGPFDVALALSRTKYATGDFRQDNIAGSWDFGVAKLMAQYHRDGLGTLNGRGILLGGTMPVGVGEFRASLARFRTDTVTALLSTPTAKKLAVGYVYHLSKRTALYATYARLNNSGGAAFALNASVTAPNASSSGYDLGIRHSF